MAAVADADTLVSPFEALVVHDGRTVRRANDVAARLTGFSRAELEGRALDELLVARSDADAAALAQHTAPGGTEPREVRVLCRRADGEEIPVLVLTAPCELDGEAAAISALRDISDFERVARDLRTRIEFEDVVGAIATDLIRVDLDQLDAALTDALQRIAAHEAVDRSYIYLIEGDVMRLSHAWATEMTRSGRPNQRVFPLDSFAWAIEKLRRGEPAIWETIEHRGAEGYGDVIWTSDSDSRLRSSVAVPMHVGGELFGYVGFDALHEAKHWTEDTIRLLASVGTIFANTYERSRAQRETREAYESLEHKVEERTRELRRKQSQLVQSEKLASLGQLVAGVAHEINTPLGAIKSNHDVLMRSLRKLHQLVADDGEVPSKLERLLDGLSKVNRVNEEAIGRIVKIVSSLRTFARLDQAELDEFDVHGGLDDTLTLVNHKLRGRIEVVRDYGDLPPVECYPNRLNQVFMNLLVNAAQAIPEKGTITVRTRVEGDSVVIEVADDGDGIPEEHLARIFDPGFTTKGVGVGTGLGLSIVHQIVEEHAGSIDVESSPAGTTVRVHVPVCFRGIVASSVPVVR